MSWTPEQEQCVMCRKHAICWAPGLHGLQAEVSGAPKEAPRTGLRKIRPTVPVLATGLAPAVAVPAVVSTLAAGEQNVAKQTLQSAFLAMYSNSESKVYSPYLYDL